MSTDDRCPKCHSKEEWRHQGRIMTDTGPTHDIYECWFCGHGELHLIAPNDTGCDVILSTTPTDGSA